MLVRVILLTRCNLHGPPSRFVKSYIGVYTFHTENTGQIHKRPRLRQNEVIKKSNYRLGQPKLAVDTLFFFVQIRKKGNYFQFLFFLTLSQKQSG